MTRSRIEANIPFPTRPARKGPPPIGRKVAPQLAALARKSGAMDPMLAERWEAVIGAELAGLCRPVRLVRQKGSVVLEVSVASGAAAMRVQYAQGQILARARDALGEQRLTRLAIKQSAGQSGSRWASRKLTAADLDREAEPVAAEWPARSLQEALARLERSVATGRSAS